MTIKRRIAKWDNFKFILILLVVVGHFINSLTDESTVLLSVRHYIWMFHMPAFIFVSGLMGKRTIDNNKWDKITPYLLFYFLLKFLIFILRSIFLEEADFSLSLFSEKGLPWYMLAMFVMFAATFYLKKFNPIFVFVLSLIFSVFFGYSSEDTTVMAFLRLVNYYPFFLLGYYLDPGKLLNILNKIPVKIVSAIIIIGAFVTFLLIDVEKYSDFFLLFSGQNAYNKMGDLAAWGGLLRLSVNIIAILMTFALISITPTKKNIFTKFGSRTLSIYSLHYVFMYPLLEGIQIQDYFMKWMPACWEVPIVIVAIAVTFICANKYFHQGVMILFDSNRWIRKDQVNAEYIKK